MPESLRWFLISTAGATLWSGFALSVVVLVLATKGDWPQAEIPPRRWAWTRLLVLLAVAWNVAMGLLIMASGSIARQVGPLHSVTVFLTPTILAGLPLIPVRLRTFVRACGVCALLLLIFSFLGGFSVGLAYPTSSVLIGIAGIGAWRAKRITRAPSLNES